MLEVCFSPAMLTGYELKDKTVVIIDIFRASSAICTALAYGVKEIIPIDSLEEAHRLKDAGCIVAAERKGEVVNGFDFGNSPYSFMDEKIRGKEVALTTTNCTHAIHQAKDARDLFIGSFLNISAIAQKLISGEGDVILLCAGWNDNFNLEDTIFAGALASRLTEYFDIKCDSAIAAMALFTSSQHSISDFLSRASHSQRLRHLNLQKDIEYCLRMDEISIVPVLQNGRLVIA